MRKMSKMDETRMVDIINAVMDQVKEGADPTEAIVALADQQGLSGEKAARVCEACNKIISIDHLSSTDKNVRTGRYPLADATAVVGRLEKRPGKVASDAPSLRKTASEGIPVYATVVAAPEYTQEERRYIDRHKNQERYDEAMRAFKLATEDYFQQDEKARLSETAANEDYKSLVDDAARLDNKDAADLARYVESTYGSLGRDLIKMLADTTGKEFQPPTTKEASAFVSPNTPFYKRVDRFMEHGMTRLEAMAQREAAVKQAGDATESALGVMKDIIGLDRGMKAVPLSGDDNKTPFSPDTTLKMRNIALKDGFANMYLDDKFLLKYPPETVLDAYNKVLQLNPELANRQNSDALITAMVKRVITSNNEIDPLEISGAATTAKAMADRNFRIDSRPWD